MADSLTTLAQLVRLNDKNAAELDVTDLLNDAPLMRALSADVASNGTSHKYNKQVGAPTVGFRAANAGRFLSSSTDELVTIDLKILDASFMIDKAIADAYRLGPDVYIAREANRHLRSSFFMAEQQFIYGTGNAADGFTGLADALGTLGTMVISAGGTGGTEGYSSVWAIRSTSDMNDCTAIIGENGQVIIGETVTTMVQDGSNKTFPGYFTPISSWLGLQIGSAFSVGRLANIDTTVGSSENLTDDLLSMLLETFPATKPPTMFAMSRKMRGQLQRSRTATNATGAPAPVPTESFGIPIVVTDSISNDENQVS